MNRMLLVLTLVVGLFSGVVAKSSGSFNWAFPLSATHVEIEDDCQCFIKEGTLVSMNWSCGNYSFAVISNSTYDCGTPTITYSWNFGDSGTATGNFVNHQYTANGTYIVVVTVTVTSQYGVCTYTLSKTITVSCFIDPPCELLDCELVNIKNVTETGVEFEYPVVDCEECPNPVYSFAWRLLGDTTWNYTPSGTATGSGSITGLDSCHQYELLIELHCDGGDEPDAQCIVPFTTTGCPAECIFDCNAVVQTGAQYDRIYFSFQPIPDTCTNCADPYYDVSWRVAGSTGAWNYGSTSVAPGAGTGSIWGLSYCTNYEFRIELRCGGTHQSPVIATCGPVAAGTRCFSGPDSEDQLLQGQTHSGAVEVQVYPNPAGAAVKFAISSELDSEGTIRIYNNTGALIRQINTRTNQVETINIEELKSGLYYYTLTTEGQQVVSESGKLVVIK